MTLTVIVKNSFGYPFICYKGQYNVSVKTTDAEGGKVVDILSNNLSK